MRNCGESAERSSVETESAILAWLSSSNSRNISTRSPSMQYARFLRPNGVFVQRHCL